MIQFILNNSLVQIDALKADTTLLNYLRLEAKLTGSKEGCASGDCGACTVVIGSLNEQENSLDFNSLNSCICLLGSLHGKQVITIEGLSTLETSLKPYADPIDQTDKKLHPLQQAMVDEHASQCGFCTPGFVMSLYAMLKSDEQATRENIIENIDGNLCRCTGYRPIIDAATSALTDSSSSASSSAVTEYSERTIEILKAINASTANCFFAPQTVDELANFTVKHPDAKLLAGGTDLVLDITQGLKSIDKIIYLGSVKELKVVQENADELLIGAAATYESCSHLLSSHHPAIRSLLSRLGSKQIRNVGTIGGNVANASPIGDMPPILLALNAELTLQKGKFTRLVKLDDFYTGYKQTVLTESEFIRDIRLPKHQANYHLQAYKISKRHADDISAICMAAYTKLSDRSLSNKKASNKKIVAIRIAMGGMAATVRRAAKCELFLVGQTLNIETLNKAKQVIREDFQPLDDVRSSKDYRLLMAQNLLERMFIELGGLIESETDNHNVIEDEVSCDE